MKLKMKTTATLLIAIFMISIFAVAVPVSAQDLEKPEFMVSAMGHYTPTFDYGTGESTVGHRCFINLHAKKLAGVWTGQGVFRDEDFSAGKLVATFTVKRISYEALPYQVDYAIKADVSIDDNYVGTFGGYATIFMGKHIVGFEAFSIQIPYLVPRGYYAFESGYRLGGEHVDLCVKLKLKELE